ncbi:MAG: UDP-N-acetylmuramate--L-alanine ligase [Patescibacteria group bacterium]
METIIYPYPPNNEVHFIGIGGIGTSALARWFLTHNYKVSGSDSESSLITNALKKEGVNIFIGHRAKNIPQKTELVIYSAAIPTENIEFKKANSLRIPMKSYAEALGDLTKQYKTIAVSGSHGKSTTTALLSLVLIKAGFDPTVIIGTKLKEFGDSNFREGKGQNLILEADEYNGSFLNYSPFAAIITNIDREHLDYYKNLTAVKKAFLKFIDNIRQGGILVVNKDDKNLFSLKSRIQKIAKKKKIKIFWYGFRVVPRLIPHISALLKIPGEHNLSNTLAVYALAKVLKIKEKDVFEAISNYSGAWRRMEYRGELRIENLEYRKKKIKTPPSILNSKSSILVYDDYAHHPTEIKATLAGIAQKWPKTPIICVFQPHQAKRLAILFKEFISAFNNADTLILLDIFKVKGRDSSASLRASASTRDVNSQKLAESIKKHIAKLNHDTKLKNIIYLPYHEKLLKTIKNIILNPQSSILNPSAIIIMMGAGDIYKMTDKLIK